MSLKILQIQKYAAASEIYDADASSLITLVPPVANVAQTLARCGRNLASGGSPSLMSYRPITLRLQVPSLYSPIFASIDTFPPRIGHMGAPRHLGSDWCCTQAKMSASRSAPWVPDLPFIYEQLDCPLCMLSLLPSSLSSSLFFFFTLRTSADTSPSQCQLQMRR